MEILICITVAQLHPFDYQRAEGQEFKRLPMKTDVASGDEDKGVVVCSPPSSSTSSPCNLAGIRVQPGLRLALKPDR